METFNGNQPERTPDRIGVRLEDIDHDALLEISRIYLEEAIGREPEDIQPIDLIRFANQTNMTHIIDDHTYGVHAYADAEFRFGSQFTYNSKLWFRKVDDETVWLEFDHNMKHPPKEYFEASKRFDNRVATYFTERNIAVPLYR